MDIAIESEVRNFCRLKWRFMKCLEIEIWTNKILKEREEKEKGHSSLEEQYKQNWTRCNEHSVQFHHSVVSNCLQPHGLQHICLPVHHQFLELTQTDVHKVDDAIQPSHPLLSSSPPAFNLSQHQGLFQWVSSSHQVAKVLEFQHQHFH